MREEDENMNLLSEKQGGVGHVQYSVNYYDGGCNEQWAILEQRWEKSGVATETTCCRLPFPLSPSPPLPLPFSLPLPLSPSIWGSLSIPATHLVISPIPPPSLAPFLCERNHLKDSPSKGVIHAAKEKEFKTSRDMAPDPRQLFDFRNTCEI